MIARREPPHNLPWDLEHWFQTPLFLAKNFCDHRIAQNGWNCRFSIADCPAVAG
jgi:hypothetical protein